MKRLTDQERAFRKAGAGMPGSRLWPFAPILVGVIAGWSDPFLSRECLGFGLPVLRGKAAVIELAIVPLCSPVLVKGGPLQWLWFALIWGPFPFAVINGRWLIGQQRYWKSVRLREAEQRRERKAAKAAADQTAADHAQGGD